MRTWAHLGPVPWMVECVAMTAWTCIGKSGMTVNEMGLNCSLQTLNWRCRFWHYSEKGEKCYNV